MVANRNLNQSGLENEHVYYVGNILVDNIRYNRHRLLRPVWFDVLNLKEQNYLLFTMNRHAILTNKENLKQLMQTLVEGIKRHAHCGSATHLCSRCDQGIEYSSRQPSHTSSAKLFVLRIPDEQSQRHYNRLG